jgi:undecaprenyl diphosphate synthase
MNEMEHCIRWVGRPKRLWSTVIKELEEAEELTQEEQSFNFEYVRKLWRTF